MPVSQNEFAVVGYRAHSMIHGEFEPTVPAGTYTDAQLDAFEAAGIEVEEDAGQVTLGIPLTVAFGNPDLVEQVGRGPLLQSLGGERQYRNDEQIDNSLRSVLFQVPKPGIPDTSVCGTPVIDRAASREYRISGRSTSSVGVTTACPPTTRSGAPSGSARLGRTRTSPGRRPHASRTIL